MAIPQFLKQILQRKLDDTRAHGRARDLSGSPATQRRIGKRELRVIERIEEFRPELHGLTLSNMRRFCDRHVPIVLARTQKDSSWCIPEQGSGITRPGYRWLRAKDALRLPIEIAGAAGQTACHSLLNAALCRHVLYPLARTEIRSRQQVVGGATVAAAEN